MSVLRINLTHICINQHSAIFSEWIELLAETLECLGHQVRLTTNRVIRDRLNILVGQTVFFSADGLADIRRSKAPFVVYQSEVLDHGQGFAPSQPAYVDFLSHACQVWDYACVNLPFLLQRGCRDVRLIPIGYSARLERIAGVPDRDIDVLFYGSSSPRRRKLLDELLSRSLRVEKIFGVYGATRDQYIARSKIVLNIHQFETPQLEQVRLSYLLNNRCFVISETSDSDPYQGGVVFTDYNNLVDCCEAFLKPEMEAERQRISAVGYEALQKLPMEERIQQALAELTTGS